MESISQETRQTMGIHFHFQSYIMRDVSILQLCQYIRLKYGSQVKFDFVPQFHAPPPAQQRLQSR